MLNPENRKHRLYSLFAECSLDMYVMYAGLLDGVPALVYYFRLVVIANKNIYTLSSSKPYEHTVHTAFQLVFNLQKKNENKTKHIQT